MLRSIYVSHLALIDEEQILLEDGLNILTGETGAGKSILIDSVSAALGTGSLKDLVKEGEDHARVELTFETQSQKVANLLEQMELPSMDGCVIITRSFRNGRSVSRINGETATVAKVREIASLLIDIHGQHEHQSLLYPKYHLELVDSFAQSVHPDSGQEGEQAGIEAEKRSCRTHYHEWKEAGRMLEQALTDERDRVKRIDFLSYEIGEIDEAALREGEDEELETRYRRLSNAQKILETASMVEELTGSDNGALMNLSKASGLLARISSLDDELGEMSSMLVQLEDLCMDFGRTISSFIDSFQYNGEELDGITRRLDVINHLKTRYGSTIPEILAYREKCSEELEKLKDYDAYVESLKNRVRKSEEALRKDCAAITAMRKKSAVLLAKQIRESLEELNFPQVGFEIVLEELNEMTENGADSAVFHISTNPGMPPRPLQDVASGGELSRIMLGIKTVMARKDSIETMIFDEIDTGISGRTAQKVSEKMAALSRTRQVIAITHLAQIASMADSHYLIEKKVEGDLTRTHVRKLENAEITDELARILGGTRITDTVKKSAEEMKRMAQEQKKQMGQEQENRMA